MRFGRWDEILAAPEPEAIFPTARAFRHVLRGSALTATGKVDEARAELQAFQSAKKQVSDTATIVVNKAIDVLGVAEQLLTGEILYREGKPDEAFAALREAVKREDALRYAEPPDWIIPVRHALGAALLQSRRYGEAEQVYRDDLKRHPENGWSLFGLARSLELSGNAEEAKSVRARFEKAWVDADVKLASSCFCQPGLAQSGESRRSGGWTTAAPRDELRPRFSYDAHGGRDGKGAFVIAADERDGLDGWWTTTVPVKGGSHYRFHAARKTDGVPLARQNAVVRIVWQDDSGRSVSLDAPAVTGYLKGWKPTAEPEYPTDKQTDAQGWTEVSDTYRVPSKATRAVIELHLQWPPPGGRIEWSEVSFEETSPPAGRRVRLAAAHFRPSGKSAAANREEAAPLIAQAAEQKADLIVLGETLTYYGLGKTPGRDGRAGARPVDRVLRRPGQEAQSLHRARASSSATGTWFTTRRSRSARMGSSWASIARSACRAARSLPASLPGHEYPVFDTRFGKLGMMVCYDGFFPEVARELTNRGAEVIAWPVWGCNPAARQRPRLREPRLPGEQHLRRHLAQLDADRRSMDTTASRSSTPRRGARSSSPRSTSTSACNGTAWATSRPSCPGIDRRAIRIDREIDRSSESAKCAVKKIAAVKPDSQATGARPLPKMSETTKSTRNTNNRILAMYPKSPARLPNPSTPATRAKMAKTNANRSICGHSFRQVGLPNKRSRDKDASRRARNGPKHWFLYRDSYRNVNRPVVMQLACHSRRTFLLPDIRLHSACSIDEWEQPVELNGFLGGRFLSVSPRRVHQVKVQY